MDRSGVGERVRGQGICDDDGKAGWEGEGKRGERGEEREVKEGVGERKGGSSLLDLSVYGHFAHVDPSSDDRRPQMDTHVHTSCSQTHAVLASDSKTRYIALGDPFDDPIRDEESGHRTDYDCSGALQKSAILLHPGVSICQLTLSPDPGGTLPLIITCIPTGPFPSPPFPSSPKNSERHCAKATLT